MSYKCFVFNVEHKKDYCSKQDLYFLMERQTVNTVLITLNLFNTLAFPEVFRKDIVPSCFSLTYKLFSGSLSNLGTSLVPAPFLFVYSANIDCELDAMLQLWRRQTENEL